MKWTPSKVERLKKLLKCFTHSQIAKKFGVSKIAIKSQCQKMNKQKSILKQVKKKIITIAPPVVDEPVKIIRPPAIYSNRNFRKELLDKYAPVV